MPFSVITVVYRQSSLHVLLLPSSYPSLSLPPLSLPSLTPIPRANLKLVRERNDYAAMGRTVGNLGNTYYLLGNYKKAIKYHEEVRWKRTNYGHTRT